MRETGIPVLVLVLVGCGPAPIDDDAGVTTKADGGTETADTAVTSAATFTTTADGETDTDDDDTDTGHAGDLPCDDCTVECDIFLQDCADGQKCVPHSVGGVLDVVGSKCVPVLGEVPVGEPCTFEGWEQTLDDCDADGFCFASEAGPGSCHGFCEGPPEDPSCGPSDACLANYGPIEEGMGWNLTDAGLCVIPGS